MIPQTYTDLAHDNLMLLTALWRQVWAETPYGWQCVECQDYADDKAAVVHQPGCALFGQDRELLAHLDAFGIKEGETV